MFAPPNETLHEVAHGWWKPGLPPAFCSLVLFKIEANCCFFVFCCWYVRTVWDCQWKKAVSEACCQSSREVWQGCDWSASGAGRREVLSVLAVAPVLSCSSMKSATSFSFFRMFFTEAALQMLLLLKTCPATTMTLGFCTSLAHLFRFQMRKNVVANFYGPSDWWGSLG